MDVFERLSVRPGAFYLPAAGETQRLWPVVACDQYTAQPEKWEQADRIVGAAPSALRLIIPECYLNESDARVPAVQAAMREYLERGALTPAVRGMVLVERETQSGKRLGLVLTADLEAYDYAPGSLSPIRPTEGTIVSRIPPRQKVRRGAALELSHVLLLCDDPLRTVIEPIYAKRDRLRPVYDVELMLDGGHLKGWAVEDEADLAAVAAATRALREALPAGGILFAVGDGNHSLATAKAHWEEIKKTLPEGERAGHPARYAMVELNNIYDNALIFEPIHRVLFSVSAEKTLAALREAEPIPTEGNADLTVVSRQGEASFRIGHALHALPVGTVQKLLDRWTGLRLDYVHGEDAVRAIVQKENAVGILLPPMSKDTLFPAVARSGPLPRKTFSMGEANEKRYYMEARKIVKD